MCAHFKLYAATVISGNLNDGPKNGENKADKPTQAPFQSQRTYNRFITYLVNVCCQFKFGKL